MSKTIKIKDRLIGEGYPAYIIAEMSANHAGDIEVAKQIIRIAKECGADCIKIQTYTADTLTIDCDSDLFKIKSGLWEGDTLYNLYSKAYTPWEWQAELKAEAEKVGIDFFSTPFDNTSVDFLEDIGMEFYKIASFELVDIPLIEYVASKGKPMIISTGMGSFDEIQDAVEAVHAKGNTEIALLKCSSAYPAVPDDMNLRTMQHMSESFDVPVGLSDHSLGSIGAVTAVAMGACIVEKHICLSREMNSEDAGFSMEPDEFKRMVDDIRTAERAKGIVSYECSNVEKGSLVFRRSLFVIRDVKKGEAFTKDNVRAIRPGHGLKPKYYTDVLGKHATCDIARGTPLRESHIE